MTATPSRENIGSVEHINSDTGERSYNTRILPSGTEFNSSEDSNLINTDVGTTIELIATFPVLGINTLNVECKVTVQDLDQFEIRARAGTNGTYQTLASASGDYTSPTGFLEYVNQFTTATGVTTADDDLTTTAALESAAFRMDVTAFDSIQIWAACSTTGGTVTTEGVGY